MHRKKRTNPLGMMDYILIVVFISLVVFTIVMIDCFKKQYAIPDTLVTCVYATLGGECGIMGMIKTSKIRYEDRKWYKEDREYERERDRERNMEKH